MDYKVEGGSLKETKEVGTLLDVSRILEQANNLLTNYKANAERLKIKVADQEAKIIALISEGKKLPLPDQELTKNEKIQLVRLGLKSASDFPGDDWLSAFEQKND